MAETGADRGRPHDRAPDRDRNRDAAGRFLPDQSADEGAGLANPLARPAWREEFDAAHICSPCREGFDSLDELVEHWDRDDERHW